MTGKEDLFGKSTSRVDVENDVWDSLNFEIMKALKKENEELSKKLEKLERVFEIFKGREVQVYPKFDGNTQYVITLNKDEYELLEELMKIE